MPVRNMKVTTSGPGDNGPTEEVYIEGLESGGGSGGSSITSAEATTLDAGEEATATIEGTTLKLGIPKGEKGDQGEKGADGTNGTDGAAATVSVGSVTSGETASVTNSGSSSAAILDFVLPKGDAGTDGANGADGKDGADGAAATVTVGSVSTLAAGSSATVTNTGTTSAAVLDFGIPRGATGAQGEAGADGEDGEGVASITLTTDAEGKVTGGTWTGTKGGSGTITVTTSE